jgi:hypothetical protein
MKNKILSLIFFFTLFIAYFTQAQPQLKTGDIIFIVNLSGQGQAIQMATKSKYTHVGIVFVEHGTPYIYHAVEPVMKSTLKEFLQFSADGNCVVKRLRDQSLLSAATSKAMHQMAIKTLGKHYDIYFNWKDDEWYCSEFVWKLYQRAYKLELSKLRLLKDYDLSSPLVQTIMNKRYGDNIPYDEKMVSPQDIFDSALLEEVK